MCRCGRWWQGRNCCDFLPQYRAGICFLLSPPAANLLADPDILSTNDVAVFTQLGKGLSS